MSRQLFLISITGIRLVQIYDIYESTYVPTERGKAVSFQLLGEIVSFIQSIDNDRIFFKKRTFSSSLDSPPIELRRNMMNSPVTKSYSLLLASASEN